MSRSSWLVVIDPAGCLLAVTSAPAPFAAAVDAAELAHLAPPLGEAMRAVAAEVRAGGARATTRVALSDADVEVLALPAIALRRRHVELAGVVARALAPFRSQAEARDVLLRFEDEGEPLALEIDVSKIAWVVATLVGNALRFVRTGSRHAPGGTITVRIRRTDRVIVEVEDDGPGIAPEAVGRLFDPAVGAAFALAMARDVARAHGGELRIHGATGADAHGTRVELELPIPAVST